MLAFFKKQKQKTPSFQVNSFKFCKVHIWVRQSFHKWKGVREEETGCGGWRDSKKMGFLTLFNYFIVNEATMWNDAEYHALNQHK